MIALKQPTTINGDVAIIHATRGDIKLDTEDLGLISESFWNVATRGCAESTSREFTRKHGKKVKMHRLIMEFPDKQYDVDHINGDQLDNRKSNLRVCTHAENGRNLKIKSNNKSGVPGVCWDKTRKKWQARIKVDYKGIHLGRFKNKNDAIRARKNAEITYFGEYTRA